MPSFLIGLKLFHRRRVAVKIPATLNVEAAVPINLVGPPHLPRELAEEITSHLWNDKSTLCTLGLVCKEFHRLSRQRLFTIVKFSMNHRFDSFLDLLEDSETTFSPLIKVLHLQALFSPKGACKNRDLVRIEHIAANLPRLKTIWLTSISWPSIPPHILLLFSKLDPNHLQLESVIFYRPEQPRELFGWLPRTLKSLTFDTLQFDGQWVEGSPAFQRPLCFKALDSTSLAIFKDVWDPDRFTNLDIVVETLHLQLSVFVWPARKEKEMDFIKRYLVHTGFSIRRLSIDLSSPTSDREVLDAYRSLDFSSCVNVSTVHIGVIELDDEEKETQITLVMWQILSSLPRPDKVDAIELTFTAGRESTKARNAKLESFEWRQTISRLQGMYRSLKKITIRVASWYLLRKDSFTFRDVALGEYEKSGLIKIEMYRWPRSSGLELPFYRLPWRQPLDLS